VREIGEHHFRAAADRTTRSGDGVGLLTRTEMMDSDVGARIRQVPRGTRAETRTGTGDARNLAREPGATCHFFSQVWWKWRCCRTSALKPCTAGDAPNRIGRSLIGHAGRSVMMMFCAWA